MPGKNAPRKVPEPERVWNLESIQQLLDLLAKKEITEFEMEQQGVKIRVRRGESHTAAPASSNGYSVGAATTLPVVLPVAAPAGPAPAAGLTAPAAPTPEPTESTEGLYIIKSPIVGTFYASPSPGAPAFVKVGDSVQMGQVICIIEAMKLMNELEADTSGQVVRVYVESGQPVEYGQALFAIEPTRKK